MMAAKTTTGRSAAACVACCQVDSSARARMGDMVLDGSGSARSQTEGYLYDAKSAATKSDARGCQQPTGSVLKKERDVIALKLCFVFDV